MTFQLRPSCFAFVALLAAGMTSGCAGNSQTPGDAGKITGTVAYRERMALPSDAVVQVQLSDISLQDVAAPLIADTTVMPEGRQVPIPFELRYDPGKIESGRRYAVRATIRSEGRVAFTTTTVTPVITQGTPTKVDLMLMRVADPAQSAPDGLVGTSWVLEDVGGGGVLDGAQATLEFPEAGKTAGRGSCNRFFGSVEITGESIAFGPIGSTRMGCPEAVMNQESKYLTALQEADRYTLDGSVLLIHTKAMDKPLRFTRQAP